MLYKRPNSCIVGNQVSVFFNATFPFSFLCPFLSINSRGLADLEFSYTISINSIQTFIVVCFIEFEFTVIADLDHGKPIIVVTYDTSMRRAVLG